MKRWTTIAAGALALAACATGGGVPKWALKGGAAFPKEEKAFYGVGRAEATIGSESLRVEAADNRARAELQRIFETYSASLMKDYSGPDGELVERAIKTFSAGNLSGAEIVDRHIAKNGTAYSLAKLDLEKFQKALELSQELNEKAKRVLRRRSEALFEEMEKEEGKRVSSAR